MVECTFHFLSSAQLVWSTWLVNTYFSFEADLPVSLSLHFSFVILSLSS